MLGLEQSLKTLALTAPPSPLPLPWNNTPSGASSLIAFGTPLAGTQPVTPGTGTPVTPFTPDTGTQAAVNARFVELEARLAEVELSTQETDAKVIGLSYKVDEVASAVAAQEAAFSKRLSDALAQLTAQALDNQALVAELCSKVQSQEAQLQRLMEEREEAPVEVESSGTAVTGAPTSSLMGRAARAAARATGLSR